MSLINKKRYNPGSQDSIWLSFDQQATELACILNFKYLYLFSLHYCFPHKQPAVSLDVAFFFKHLTMFHSPTLIDFSVKCTETNV